MSSALTVRSASVHDAAACRAIYAPIVRETSISFEFEVPTVEVFAQRIAETLERYPYLVAEDADGCVVGYVYATSWRARSAYAQTCEAALYIAADTRGRGVGRALMNALLPELRQRGFHQVIAGTTLPNPPSVGILESLGFQPAGTFREVGRKFDEWRDVGFWQLGL